jgi:propanol-preferring alcohol dehydrogenase
MKAQRLLAPRPIAQHPLVLTDVDRPIPRANELLLRIHTCGVCHTDLHVVEGDLDLPRLPVTPGHQIVGTVEEIGSGVTRFSIGDRAGVPWLYQTCGDCEYCKSGRENLCDDARFTGYHADGGYAEYMCVNENFAYSIPDTFSDIQAAPLLCAGVIGYRSLRLSNIQRGQRIGLYGFGASAHIAIQIVRH